MNARTPVRSASPAVREFFTMLDATSMTHAQVSDIAGVSLISLGRWRDGKSTPHVYDLECLGVALGYKLVWEKLPPKVTKISQRW